MAQDLALVSEAPGLLRHICRALSKHLFCARTKACLVQVDGQGAFSEGGSRACW